MANQEHLPILSQGVGQWNKWRSENVITPDLSCANLSGINLDRAHLSSANLTFVNLNAAKLVQANLNSANLSGANLSCANLSCANLSGANLSGARLLRAKLNAIRGCSGHTRPGERSTTAWQEGRSNTYTTRRGLRVAA